jgi:hypothetical protein
MMILEECTTPAHRNRHCSKLRNLGIALAEIMLARPIRLLTSATVSRYEQFCDGSWNATDVSELVDDVLMAYSSEPLCEAIMFCLGSECDIALKPFEPGYLFRCIDRIYTP